jgi:hypothetical protein
MYCVRATRCGATLLLFVGSIHPIANWTLSTIPNRSYRDRIFYQAEFCGSNGVILGEIGWTVVEIMAPGRLVARKNQGKTTIQVLPPTINLSSQFF